MARTLQTNIKKFNDADARKYALFLGGINVTQKALQHYDPQKTGYDRWFIIQLPKFMELIMPDESKNFKHLIETASTSFQGLGNLSMDFEAIQGGIVGSQFEVPTLLKDDTTEITISIFDSAGSPIREYLTMWATGISDKLSGYGHYHGALDNKAWHLSYAQANHTMEMIYVATDPTGRADSIEYACLLTNMVPKAIRLDHYNFEAGQVQTVKYDITFTVNRYDSADINARAKELLEKYNIRKNYIDMASGYTSGDIEDMPDYELVNQ